MDRILKIKIKTSKCGKYCSRNCLFCDYRNISGDFNIPGFRLYCSLFQELLEDKNHDTIPYMTKTTRAFRVERCHKYEKAVSDGD